jgi:hypothetical protein
MSLLDNLPHRCTIRRRVRTKGALGGSRDTFTNEQTDVECWEQQASAKETEAFQKRDYEEVRKVYFATDPSVTTRHQILVTEKEGVAVTSPADLDVLTEALPDAGAGLGAPFKVMCGRKIGRAD